jgi:putative membrane protein
MSIPTLAVCSLLAFAGTAYSADSATENRGQLSNTDYKFAVSATRGGAAEVNLAQVAIQKAADPGVRQFAQRMLQDHTKANQQLAQILSQKGVTIPTETSSSEQREVDRLQKLSGADFDKAYMDHMLRDHKKDVKEFEKASESATDTDIKAFAANTLPILQDHLRMAEELDKTARAEKKQS